MGVKRKFKSLVEKLLLEGRTACEIVALVPGCYHQYVSCIRGRLGIPRFGYAKLRGTRIDGKRMGPITKEWLIQFRKIDAAGCWNWTRSINKVHGYAQVKDKGSQRVVSRVAFRLWFREIPEGLGVLHRCDNPRCFNPDHLFLGTQSDNALDMGRKRRGRFRTFSAEQVIAIRQSGDTPSEIAKRHGITASAICAIRGRRSYKWVEQPTTQG